MEASISSTEKLLKEIGYSVKDNHLSVVKKKKNIIVPTWEEMCNEASKIIEEDISIGDLFTDKELDSNEEFINNLNNEFKSIYKLDKTEIVLSVVAGLLIFCYRYTFDRNTP